ncbi:outer membrane beta-barrel protein [Luteimonas sp. RC10]|uniref:outer membrane beta-barrel protein n=1 Tax=Luteimonas sp. RC10 TaxID=2587035 RepID=UPI00161647C0|nr:outer membrane beta-barrel protein [Luteimonas sp. RC10]MBB3344102.1 hypothetical protein [Luteimonas sp. RC10]
MKPIARHLLAVAAAAVLPIHAQSLSPAWTEYRQRQQTEQTPPAAAQPPAHRAAAETAPPPARLVATEPTHAVQAPPSPAVTTPATETPRGAAFVALQAGQAWIYDDVRQDTQAVSAGYRWQAGPVVQVGIEGVAARIDATSKDGWRFGGADYGSLGANARFQFGRTPLFALARLGYWYADVGEGDSADGGYAGVGLGVDIHRHVNLTLAYTYHLYASSDCYRVYSTAYCDTDINRADLVTLGLEARF